MAERELNDPPPWTARDAAFLLGVALLAIGCWCWSPGLAFVVVGCLLLVGAVWGHFHDPR